MNKSDLVMGGNSKFDELFDFQEYIESLIARKESFDLEFKSAAGGFPGSFWDTYSAFANTQGGIIVLGVKEKDNAFSMDNISEELIVKYKKEFWSNANNKNTVNVNLLNEDDVKEGVYKDKRFLLFYIPRAERTQRPVYRGMNPYNGAFKRNYEGDYKCTALEVSRMFADADETRPRDGRILKGFTMDDIDPDSLKQYRQLFSTVKPNHTWLTLNDFDLIKKLGAYRVDRESKEEGFTLAGLLMFGKADSINDPECAPNYFPDYREIPTSTSTMRWLDRVYPDGTWEINLFQFYKRVLPKLVASLPKPFILKNNIRIDETPTHVALREALVNSLIHSDYSADSSLVVEQRSDCFLFSNPGSLLISRKQYYEGGESICRNKTLQKMFMLIGSAEKAGSGVDKILAGWKDANWKQPYLEEKNRPDKVVLYLPMESLLSEEVLEHLKSLFGEQIEHIGYDSLRTLSLCITEGYVTNDRLQYAIDKHSADITKMLRELCNNGYIVPEGNGRGTKYYVATLPSNVATSAPNVATSPSNVVSSAPNVVSSPSNVVSSAPNVVSSISKKYMKREELEQLILDCTTEFLSSEEIAKKVKRDVKYLNNHIIPSMLSDGKLERFYSEKTHPNQKYKAKKLP